MKHYEVVGLDVVEIKNIKLEEGEDSELSCFITPSGDVIHCEFGAHGATAYVLLFEWEPNESFNGTNVLTDIISARENADISDYERNMSSANEPLYRYGWAMITMYGKFWHRWLNMDRVRRPTKAQLISTEKLLPYMDSIQQRDTLKILQRRLL